MSIHATEESIFSHINHELQTHGIEDVQAADLVEVTVDYIRGATSEELGIHRDVFLWQLIHKILCNILKTHCMANYNSNALNIILICRAQLMLAFLGLLKHFEL